MEKWFFGNHSLDTLKSKLYYKGEALEVEPQVYCILELLITRHGEIISRDEIIAEVWNGRVISNNLIDNRIRAARAAIGDTGKAQRYYIQAVIFQSQISCHLYSWGRSFGPIWYLCSFSVHQ